MSYSRKDKDTRLINRAFWKAGLHGAVYTAPGVLLVLFDRFVDGNGALSSTGHLGIGLVVLGVIALIPGMRDKWGR